jgi:hypothetical protein
MPIMGVCNNCLATFPDRTLSTNAPAVAWYWSCRACADLAAAQMQQLQPELGQPPRLRILRCRRCGLTRAAFSGWKTLCHVCVDDRATGDRPDGTMERHPDSTHA